VTRDVAKRQWTAVVLAAPQLTPVTARGLLQIAEIAMTANGSLDAATWRLTDRMNKTPRQITRYLQAAYEAGFLKQTSAGCNDHAARYQATIPERGERVEPRPKKGMKTDILVSVSYRECEQGERVAVNRTATGETTTAALAAVHPATSKQRK
jgi:hypothetical protein